MPKYLSEINADGGIDGYWFPVSFHIPGTLTTGVRTPEFLAPVACTVVSMKGRVSAGSAVTYRPVQNAATNGTTSASTSTSVVTTSQSLSLAADDRLRLEIVSAGSGGTDLSVTFWLKVT